MLMLEWHYGGRSLKGAMLHLAPTGNKAQFRT